MANYKFPDVDFDWLGELPGIYKDASAYRERKAALADLPENATPAELRARANRLLRSPDLKTQEAGHRLYNMALGREGLAQKGTDQAKFMEILPFLQGRGGGGAPAPGGQPSPGPQPDPLQGGPWGDAPTQGLQVPPDRQSAIPTEPLQRVAALGGAPIGTPPPEGAPPPPTSPSEQLLAQAEDQPGQAPPAPVRMAQAPGSSLQQGMNVPLKLTVTPSPMTPGPPGSNKPKSYGPTGQEDAMARAKAAGDALIALGPFPKATSAIRKFTEDYRRAMEDAKIPPEWQTYQLDRAQALRHGEPDFSHTEWQLKKAHAGKFIDEMLATQKEITDDSKKATNLLGTLTHMQNVVDNKSFNSGELEPDLLKWRSQIITLANTAKNFGVDIDRFIPDLNGIKETTRLQEVFTALSNQVIYDKLGSLGNQISTSDREFVEKAFPSLRTSKEGNKLMITILRDAAKHAIKMGEGASKYREQRGDVFSTGPGMRAATKKYAEEHPLFTDSTGKLTPLGEKAARDIDKVLGSANARNAPAQPPPPEALSQTPMRNNAPPELSGKPSPNARPMSQGNQKIWWDPETGQVSPRQ